MVNPRATNEDLTAKARIRNAALDLYSQYGEDRVSLRAVAAEAGVTLGLVQHHYKTKARLGKAVDQLVVDYVAFAIAEVPSDGSPGEVAAARDTAVRAMLQNNPVVVNYIRRAMMFEPTEERLDRLELVIDLTRREVKALRSAGLASTTRPESLQILSVFVSQMGELLLRPLVDAVWDRVGDPGDGSLPRLQITIDR